MSQIATLPENPYPDTPSPTFEMNENNALNITDYSDKTFIVFGEATKTYKQQMKDLGGKFNGRLKEKPGFPGGAGWIFMLKFKPQVYEFVNKVNQHEINHHENVAGVNDDHNMKLPTVVAPVTDAKYQTVHWKVFKPATGMKVTVKAGGDKIVGDVIQTESHRNYVDTAYVNLNGNTSKLVICNGNWSVWGYMVDHTVMFSDNTVQNSPEKESPKKNYNYEDIANI